PSSTDSPLGRKADGPVKPPTAARPDARAELGRPPEEPELPIPLGRLFLRGPFWKGPAPPTRPGSRRRRRRWGVASSFRDDKSTAPATVTTPPGAAGELLPLLPLQVSRGGQLKGGHLTGRCAAPVGVVSAREPFGTTLALPPCSVAIAGRAGRGAGGLPMGYVVRLYWGGYLQQRGASAWDWA